MSAPSPLFAQLANMLQTAAERLHALDVPGSDDMPACRVWSRQRNAVEQAILAEPPVTVAEALIVLSCRSEFRDRLDGATEELSDREQRDFDETTTIALINVNTCLAGTLAKREDHTADYQETVDWIGHQAHRWLPLSAGEVA